MSTASELAASDREERIDDEVRSEYPWTTSSCDEYFTSSSSSDAERTRRQRRRPRNIRLTDDDYGDFKLFLALKRDIAVRNQQEQEQEEHQEPECTFQAQATPTTPPTTAAPSDVGKEDKDGKSDIRSESVIAAASNEMGNPSGRAPASSNKKVNARGSLYFLSNNTYYVRKLDMSFHCPHTKKLCLVNLPIAAGALDIAIDIDRLIERNDTGVVCVTCIHDKNIAFVVIGSKKFEILNDRIFHICRIVNSKMLGSSTRIETARRPQLGNREMFMINNFVLP